MDAAIRNQGASIKALEIQIRQMRCIEGIRKVASQFNKIWYKLRKIARGEMEDQEGDQRKDEQALLDYCLGKLAPTKLIIELADKTVKHSKGIAENVLVRIDKFVFPVDFIVLDMPEDTKILLILRRPFLSTVYAKVYVFKRKFALRIRNDKIVSEDPEYGDFIELNNLNEPLELRRNHEMVDLDPTIEEGEVIDEPMKDVVKTRHNSEIIEGIEEYPVVENINAYRDKDMGDVIVAKKFCRNACVEAKRFGVPITIYNGNDSVT
nr:hypothetical protein [Tanacetum cinerariifolium]